MNSKIKVLSIYIYRYNVNSQLKNSKIKKLFKYAKISHLYKITNN